MGQLDFFSELVRRVIPAAKPAPAAKPPAPAVRARSQGSTTVDPVLIERCRELLLPLNCPELAKALKVVWNGRMRSTAGMAYPGRSLIKLNPRLREFGEEEVDRTLRHELAHLLAQFRVGRRRIAPHGHEWQKACADLGIAKEARCHTLPLPQRKIARRHLYRCPKCGIELRRVRPLKRPTACLVCCRAHAGGRYDDRFRFQRVKVPA